MKPNEFMRRWIDGMTNLTPVQQLQIKKNAYLGGMFGLIFATVTLILYGTWNFTIFLIFMIVIQYVEWVGARKMYLNALEIEYTIQQQKMEGER